MTADIRTAAQREVRKPASEGNPIAQFGVTTDIAFVRGAVWAAARVTPTREQIVVALLRHPYVRVEYALNAPDAGWCGCGATYQGGVNSPAHAEHLAGVIAALMQELAEGESGG